MVSLGNDWDNLLAEEFQKDYYLNLREFLKKEYFSRRIYPPMNDIYNGLNYQPPMHLRDAHYKDASKYGFGVDYVYTHSNPDVKQQFMPDELKDKKYFV